jgi:hypothetical protein
VDSSDAGLAVHPCQGICAWALVPETAADPVPRFACSGCASEWVRTEAWTPIGSDGVVPEDVRREAARR